MRHLLLILFFIPLGLKSQLVVPSEIWDSVKNNTFPILTASFADQYEAPYRMPLADYGWEDGLQISSDGLNLYALYTPGDLLSWYNFIGANVGLPPCNTLGNTIFLRHYANDYGMDMTTNFFGCDTALNIDILYSKRNNLLENFENWQLSDIGRGALIEAGPFPLFSVNDPEIVDHFIFTGNGDIWMINNTSANPNNIESAIRLPSPINPPTDEFIADNPILKRMGNSDTLLIIYEKYLVGEDRDFMYAFSYDDGNTWETPSIITTVNNDVGHIEHPQLYFDGENTYLYYTVNYDIYRSRQSIPGNWDSWVDREAIVLKGNALALGEPSLASNGDMSFLVAYENTNTTNPNDRFDCDPWYLKNLFPPSNIPNSDKKSFLEIFPNPASDYLYFDINSSIAIHSIDIYDINGNIMISLISPDNKIDITSFATGMYLIEIITDAGVVLSNKFIISR